MQYYDLKLWIYPKPEGKKDYPTRASFMGQFIDGTSSLNPFDEALTVLRQRFVTGTADKAICESLGALLFTGLFQDEIGDLFHESLGSVRAWKAGLCIRLVIEPPEMAALPWELLYYKREDCFLATSRETTVLRSLELPTVVTDLDTELPLKVLLVIPDNPDLNTADEEKRIVQTFCELKEKALAEVGRNAIEWNVLNGDVPGDRINSELNRKQYHIIHFIGHGSFEAGQGRLKLTPGADNDGSMTAEMFGEFFIGNRTVKLVFLNSCKSAASSLAQLLTGVGQQIVKRSVPAVVAMQFSITDPAARIFADVFYENLFIGMDLGRIDTAVSNARRWVMQKFGKTADFVAPVLFLQSVNGIIFDYEQLTPKRSFIDEIHRVNAITETRRSNVSVLKTENSVGATPEITEQIKAENVALANLRKRLLRVYSKVLAAALPQLALVVLAVSLFSFFAYYTKFFNILHLDDLMRHKFLSHLGGHVNNPINDKVRIILMDEGDNQGLGPFTQSINDENKAAEWRKRHARLIEGLTAMGAKVIAFDLVFGRQTQEEANQKICSAISGASGKTEVMAGKRVENGKTLPTGEMTPTLRACFKENWGNTHVGIQRWDLVQEYELAHKTVNPNTASLIPSFALQAIAKFDGDTPLYNEAANLVQGSSASSAQEIPVRATGPGLNMLIGYADDEDLNLITRDYTATYQGLERGDTGLSSDFGGRIVLVGGGGEDLKNVLGGSKPRYGVHIHANVISNILNRFYVYRLSSLKNFLVILVMAIIGILIQTRFRSWLRPTITIPLFNTEKKLPLLFALIILAYAVVAFVVFQRSHIIFDASYHLLAFIVGFFAVGIFRRKLGLK